MSNNDNTDHSTPVGTARGLLAVSPVVMFLVLYVAVSAIIGDFYRMPVSVALVVSSIWAVAIFRGRPLQARITAFSRAAGHENILYMIWIFILAGAFAAIAKEIGAVLRSGGARRRILRR